ncbi:DUF3833 domain-containing protein [Chromatocurvus halotolerans]|uniref:Uncharacterized protein DUF3833 n=1 Tax=Chromatocurvus halotolerans TaxID=1132028 RepID=A0A4R2KS69_9GAMM|nr:uncharacterized protein DUF3833 [Chromatocurvus halotolerans]
MNLMQAVEGVRAVMGSSVRRLFLTAAMTMALGACTTVSVSDYRDETPTFDPEAFFSGELVAHGMLKDRRGRVTRRFIAEIDASWRDGVGTLDEQFVFSDGEESQRVWTLRPDGPGRYIGTAGDVVGESPVTVAGNAMFLDYTLRVPYGDGTIDVKIDDRMYLIDGNTLLNESVMRKFGFRVGEIVLVIRRVDHSEVSSGALR